MKDKKSKAYDAYLKKREESFNLNISRKEKLNPYNPLGDTNLRHYFESNHLQTHLYNNGMIDETGRVIDIDKHKNKIAIIEQEFKNAEKSESIRLKEEEEMRRRIQLKRYEALNNSRNEEKIAKMKEDRKIRQEIVSASKNFTTSSSAIKMKQQNIVSYSFPSPKKI